MGEQEADKEALANQEDTARDVTGCIEQLEAEQASLQERLTRTQEGLAAAQQQATAKKAEHEACASANRKALYAPNPILLLCLSPCWAIAGMCHG